jgi:hypothetical protein
LKSRVVDLSQARARLAGASATQSSKKSDMVL